MKREGKRQINEDQRRLLYQLRFRSVPEDSSRGSNDSRSTSTSGYTGSGKTVSFYGSFYVGMIIHLVSPWNRETMKCCLNKMLKKSLTTVERGPQPS